MNQIEQVIIALTGLVVALYGLVPAFIKLWQTVSRNTRMIDEDYAAHLLRGKVEALRQNLVVETFDEPQDESFAQEGAFMPLAVRKSIHAMYDKIAPKLRVLRAKHPDATEVQLGRLIEREHGLWLAKNICLKLGVWQYACLAMALSIANGIPPVNDSVHD